MSKDTKYYFIPDYFIVDGVRIGKQDPGYDECVTKYCAVIDNNNTVIVKDKKEEKHE